ncbi:MAG: nuclear transport factor 2 family protein [Chloroflexi bacterium]|nr:nuclear transport factor 2 family protein [Chloroflexota bacterium]
MYHRIVKRVVQRTFVNLNHADYQAVMASYVPDVQHTMAGEHALGGTRHTLEAVEQWYKRLFAVFGAIRFTVRNMLIQGMPWDTKIAVKVEIAATLRDGRPYSNQLAMFVDLKWGRITRIDMHEDTQKLAATLQEIARMGVAEAAAAPITSQVYAMETARCPN